MPPPKRSSLADDVKSGELGYRIGRALWNPPYDDAGNLKPGRTKAIKDLNTYDSAGHPVQPLSEAVMGYYQAGDATGWHAPMLVPQDSGTGGAGGNLTIVTPALAAWRAKHPGHSFPGGGVSGYRRMNVGNVKALRRSMRRVTGFAHLAKKVMTFTSKHKMKTRKRSR